MKARCFKCEKVVRPADRGGDAWGVPCNAVSLSGGHSFGSGLYDTLKDGKSVEILVCDACLKAALGSDRLREHQMTPAETKAYRDRAFGCAYTKASSATTTRAEEP